MKRFYKDVDIAQENGAWSILLDGRPVKTPHRAALALPSTSLAQAVAQEWRDQGDKIVPASMPLTQMANTALDRVAPARATIADQIAGYAASDLLCYRADQPAALTERQAAAWDPVLDWAAATFDTRLNVTVGVMPIDQPPAAIDAVRQIASGLDDFSLTGLGVAASVTGSAVLGLALVHGRLEPSEALALAHVDEDFQIERWGKDYEAMKRRAALSEDVFVAHRMVRLTGAE